VSSGTLNLAQPTNLLYCIVPMQIKLEPSLDLALISV